MGRAMGHAIASRLAMPPRETDRHPLPSCSPCHRRRLRLCDCGSQMANALLTSREFVVIRGTAGGVTTVKRPVTAPRMHHRDDLLQLSDARLAELAADEGVDLKGIRKKDAKVDRILGARSFLVRTRACMCTAHVTAAPLGRTCL